MQYNLHDVTKMRNNTKLTSRFVKVTNIVLRLYACVVLTQLHFLIANSGGRAV
jgi:hypothetical protein